MEVPLEKDWAPFAKQLYTSLTEPQREVWDAPERFKLLCSGRRFGKTYLCISRLVAWAIEHPGSLELVRHSKLQISETDRVASAKSNGAH